MSKQILQCPFCPKTSSRGTGLASHIRGAHPTQYAAWSEARKRLKTTGASPSSFRKTEPAAGLRGIIARLEKRSKGIEKALAALRAVE
jgi:hypothetical protein